MLRGGCSCPQQPPRAHLHVQVDIYWPVGTMNSHTLPVSCYTRSINEIQPTSTSNHANASMCSWRELLPRAQTALGPLQGFTLPYPGLGDFNCVRAVFRTLYSGMCLAGRSNAGFLNLWRLPGGLPRAARCPVATCTHMHAGYFMRLPIALEILHGGNSSSYSCD